MSLMDRARKARDEQDGATDARVQTESARYRAELASVATRILELESGRVTADDLSPVHASTARRSLYRFELEGMHFVVGLSWRDGRDQPVLAVRVETVRGAPEWPPPAGSSSGHWAPFGYKRVRALADLARAVDR